MSTTHYSASGYDGTSAIVWYPNQPTKERTGELWEYVWRGWCGKGSVDTLLPDDMDPMSSGSDYLLSKAAISDTDAPDIVNVTLTYTLGGASVASPIRVDDVEQRCEVCMVDAPVEAAYNSEDVDLRARAEAARDRQEKTIPIGGLSYEYAYHSASFVWSEENLTKVSTVSIGKIGAPTGIDSPTDKHWILRGKRIEQLPGGLTRIGERWEFSPIKWIP